VDRVSVIVGIRSLGISIDSELRDQLSRKYERLIRASIFSDSPNEVCPWMAVVR
jgi:hypothetical protein